MSDSMHDVSRFKLGADPISCKYLAQDGNWKFGIFHQIAHDTTTDEGDNRFAVTSMLVEEEGGSFVKLDPVKVKLLRNEPK